MKMAQRTKSPVKKKTKTMKDKLAIYLIGLAFSIYAGFLVGAVWLEGNSISEFLDNFVTFIIEEHHYIVGVTEATGKSILLFSCVWTMAAMLKFTKKDHPYAGEEYGSAKWGEAKSFTKEFACHDPKYVTEVMTGDEDLGHPLKVNCANYWIAEGVYISIFNTLTANLNILVVGPPGSGKSFRVAKPLMSQLCGNFIVTDPKGELYRETGQFFEDNGYEVMVMNVESEEGMPMSIHFNPFEYIHNESGIMSIAAILMKATTPIEDGGSSDRFFEQSAEVLLTSIIYLIHYFYPKEEQNWRTFVKLLDATCVYTNKDGAIENREGGILDIARKAQEAWKKDHPDSDFPGYMAIEKYYNGAAETTSSIVASLDAHARYMKLECVTELLSEDEIRIVDSFAHSKPGRDCRSGKRILYIVTSEDKRYYDWIPSMLYSMFFDELYHITDTNPAFAGSLPNHLTFLMDEFANVTLPESFVDKLSTMRSRNISSVIIVQNLQQLKRKFPKCDMDKELLGHNAIIEILGAPDMDSCEYLSKHFGMMTINKATESDPKGRTGTGNVTEDVVQKPLFPAQDIFAMKKDGECAIVVKGTDPLYEPKCHLENTDFIKLLCRKKNPYDPRVSLERRRKRRHDTTRLVLAGDEARKEAKLLMEEGEEIQHLTIEEANAYGIAIQEIKQQESAESHELTIEERKAIEENAKRRKERIRQNRKITFDEFRSDDDGTQCDEQTYMERCITVRHMINEGYSNIQIRSLKPLIMNGYGYEMISDLFSTETDPGEIEEYTAEIMKTKNSHDKS